MGHSNVRPDIFLAFSNILLKSLFRLLWIISAIWKDLAPCLLRIHSNTKQKLHSSVYPCMKITVIRMYTMIADIQRPRFMNTMSVGFYSVYLNSRYTAPYALDTDIVYCKCLKRVCGAPLGESYSFFLKNCNTITSNIYRYRMHLFHTP